MADELLGKMETQKDVNSTVLLALANLQAYNTVILAAVANMAATQYGKDFEALHGELMTAVTNSTKAHLELMFKKHQ